MGYIMMENTTQKHLQKSDLGFYNMLFFGSGL